MAEVSDEEKVALFEDPRTFPDRPERVESIETHFAWIFLSPRFAYKLKKPIRFGAIDFRNAEARRAYCELEVTLNRRLAEEIYLRVVPVVAASDGLRLGGDGEIVDAVVEMRRLPDSSLVDLGRSRSIGAPELDGIVEKLVAFYARTPVAPWDGPGYVEALRRFALRNGSLVDGPEELTADNGISKDIVERVTSAQLDFIERHRNVLEQRAADGRIVDAHGDLRAEHVFLTDRPQIIDCLEFSIGLRWLDTAEEVAFLALDCDRHRIEVADRLLAAYRRHAADPVPEPLLLFYRSRRALSRAVLYARRVPEAGPDADVWRARAQWYLDAASASIAAASGD